MLVGVTLPHLTEYQTLDCRLDISTATASLSSRVGFVAAGFHDRRMACADDTVVPWSANNTNCLTFQKSSLSGWLADAFMRP